MKLISLDEFLSTKLETGYAVEQITKLRNYANFLNTPLHPSQFVAMDDDGNVLEEPKPKAIPTNEDFDFEWIYDEEEVFQWKQTQSKVLFEVESYTKTKIKSTSFYCWRFTFRNGSYFDYEEDVKYTISDLIPYNLTLTATAQKPLKNEQ